MNRRQFIAGLAASTVPAMGVGTTSVLSDVNVFFDGTTVPELLPLAASFKRTKEMIVANIMNSGSGGAGLWEVR